MSTTLRAEFAIFLLQIADGDVDRGKWQKLIVNHYFDERLEEIRREVVRMFISENRDAAQLKDWAIELSDSVVANYSPDRGDRQ